MLSHLILTPFEIGTNVTHSTDGSTKVQVVGQECLLGEEAELIDLLGL